MNTRKWLRQISMLLLLALLFSGPAFAGSGTPILREKATVVVDGVEETWRLEWLGPPKPVCDPDDDGWMTCPCEGFAFGESGDLQLVRERDGRTEEVLHLTPFFDNEERPAYGAVLRRWDEHKDDFDRSKSPDFGAIVRARPLSKIMKFADYDHNGQATEFMLQVGNAPCGKLMCVVVGVSRANPHLHALASAKDSKKPMILRDDEWEALAKAKNGAVTVVDWVCGDHGGGEQTEISLSAQDGRIRAVMMTYRCRGTRKTKLTEKKEF